jgi:hypothetical protein
VLSRVPRPVGRRSQKLGNGSQEKGTPASNDGTSRTVGCAQTPKMGSREEEVPSCRHSTLPGSALQLALSNARVSDGKERTKSETFSSSFRISRPHLPQLRSWRVVIRWPRRRSVLIVCLRAESQFPGSTPAGSHPARCPWKPCLRGVRTPRDAVPPRRSIPLSGVRFGGATHNL